jgi:cyclophilin family peptidyl-prolyl cis-trans isomerase
MMTHGIQCVWLALCVAAQPDASLADASLADESLNDAPLQVERLYNPVDTPLMVRVAVPPEHVIGPESGDPPRLVMMDFAGQVIARPALVRPGRVDLAEHFTELWSSPQAGIVQLFTDDGPLGPPLILVPMQSPRTPQTELAPHPVSGEQSTQIVGWDEADPDVFSGYRVYIEQDALLHTSEGTIRITLRPDHAPNTVWNFMSLIEGGLYDGTVFHRVVPLTRDGDPFVIQGGDPSDTGQGGPGYELALEPSRLRHEFGVISMARADGPDTAGSQFFICLSREGTARLDGQYCAFGYVVDGGAAVLAIADTELADVAAGRPIQPPIVHRAELIAAEPRIVGRPRSEDRIRRPDPQPDQPSPGRVPR